MAPYDFHGHLVRHLQVQGGDWAAVEQATTGLPLRYLLTLHLLADGPLTVAELVERLEVDGIRLLGRPGKVVSDSLRWEIGRRRVVRVGRGRYAAGVVPRQTLSRMRSVVAAERQRVALLAEPA